MDRKMFEAGLNKAHGEAIKMDKQRDQLLKDVAAKKEKIAEIEGKPETGASFQREKTAAEKESIAEWENFYKETFGVESDFSKLEIPEQREGFEKLLIVEKGMDAQKLFDKCKELFSVWKYTDKDLNKVITSTRKVEAAYAIWLRDRIEADEENKNLSANDVKEKGINTETLEERLLQELEYFKKTGEHLDIQNATLCAGSRFAFGHIPDVHWHDSKLKVSHSCHPDDADDYLRAREAVSSAEGGK